MSGITKAMVKKGMVEDLNESGITTRTQLNHLKFNPLSLDECEEITNFRLPAYEIPYFNENGKVLREFIRVKFLAPVPGSPGQKYWQKADTLPHAYLPPVLKRSSWKKILEDPSVPIYITEGEKKAACACIKGIACIGLGGVWSFKSKKAGQSLIAELSQAVWKGREVNIVFDSDVMTKPDVIRALHTLTSVLREQGATRIQHIYLDSDGDDKMGLDDFLVKYGIKALEKRTTSSGDELLDRLHEMNSRYAIVDTHKEKIFSLDTQMFLSSNGFVSITEAANRVEIIDANNKPKTVDVSKEWLRWTNRRTLTDITFAPGEEKITKRNEYNLWDGYPYVPKKGDVTLFLELVDHVFSNSPKEAKNWFMQWAAHPLQEPGTKMHSSVLIWGAQGTGKSFLGLILKSLYGEYGRSISHGSITGDFNSWAARAQFVLADEAIFHGNRRESATLKNIITQETVDVNIKYQPSYTIRDFIAYFFTSNYHDAIYMEPGDRRFLVAEIQEKKSPAFYKKLDTWLKKPSSRQAIMYHMVHKVNLAGFEPKAEPPGTVQKQDMIHDTMSSLDQVINYGLENPEEFFRVAGTPINRGVFTADEIFHLLPDHITKNTTTNAVGHALRRAGCPKRALMIQKPGHKTRTTKRVYIVDPKLDKKTTKQLSEHYVSEMMDISGSNVIPIDKKRKKKFVRS